MNSGVTEREGTPRKILCLLWISSRFQNVEGRAKVLLDKAGHDVMTIVTSSCFHIESLQLGGIDRPNLALVG
jgi:hypothetical protein